jgi:hypothetical protein
MSGLEIVQVVSSVAELVRVSFLLFQFFQRLRNADRTAKESCQRIRELHRVIEGVELALRRRQAQVEKTHAQDGEEMVWGHLRSSTRGAVKILLKIRREYTPFEIETTPSVPERVIRQIRFEVIRKEALSEHYTTLDTQLQMLQVNSQTLNL